MDLIIVSPHLLQKPNVNNIDRDSGNWNKNNVGETKTWEDALKQIREELSI